jgi:DNA-binding NarL/FixJ family response regulator
MKPSVLLVDDHAVVREGLGSLLAMTGEFGAILHAEDAEHAVAVARDASPDIVVVDLLMPNIPGPGAIRMLKVLCPDAHFVVLTSAQDEQLALAAIDAGARSFLLKSMDGDEILSSFRSIRAGMPVVHSSIAALADRARPAREPARPGRFAALTPREIDVLVEMANGASNAKIAYSLDITERTVKAHVGAIFAKLNVADRTEAVAFA